MVKEPSGALCAGEKGEGDMSIKPALSVVDEAEMPSYPISAKDRLDSHYFLQWNLKRWRGSNFRKKAYSDPEVGWYGFELFCLCQDETPIGTLPCDPSQLAFVLHLSLEKWLSLSKREFSPLHGWSEVMCDNGEVRYAHPIVTEVALEALGSKVKNAVRLEAARQRKRFADLKLVVGRIGAKQLLSAGGFVERFDEWLLENRPNQNRTEGMIREALDVFQVAP